MEKKTRQIAVILLLITLILIVSVPTNLVKAPSTPKIVYIVISVDTEMSSGHSTYLGTTNPHPTFDMSEYALSPPSTISQVYSDSFRNSHRDSFGDSFKMTWYAEMDYVFSQANFVYSNGSSAGVSGYTAVLDLLQNNWGTQIQMYGDSIEWHHHFVKYDGTWQRYNNGPDAGYPDYQMYALDHMIVDRVFYPSAFRSGWNIMSTSQSNWIEQWIPFDYCPISGGWSPVHAYPGMNHWETQTGQNVNEVQIDSSFARARDNGSAIYSFYTHDNVNMQSLIATLHDRLAYDDNDEVLYPGVTFKYVTARQAMQLALGFTDFTEPTFTVTRNGGTYTIFSSETLWGNSPYVALRYLNGTYTHVSPTPVEAKTWIVSLTDASQLDRIGVAGSDLCGNPGVLVFSSLDPPTASTPTVPPLQPSSLPEVQLKVIGVTASSYSGNTYNPGMAIDGIASTSNYWSTLSGLGFAHWLKLDLWSLVPINQVTTNFYDGDARTYTYYVEVSGDGSSWVTVVPTKNSKGLVTDTFSEIIARFVRITVTGNTANNGAHIEEIKVYQLTPSSIPTPTPTPALSTTPSPIPTPSATPIPTLTPTATPTSSPTPTPALSTTPSPIPTPSATPIPTLTPTATPTSSPTPTPALSTTPSPIPTPSATPIPTLTPTATPTSSPTPTPALSTTPSPIPTPSAIAGFLSIQQSFLIVAVIIGGVLAAVVMFAKKS